MSKRTQKKGENKTKKVLSIVAWILSAVIVLGVVGVYTFVNSGMIERNTVAAKTENFSVNTSMMTYLYNTSYQNMVSQYGSYLESYLGLDTGKALDEQTYAGNQTWHDYFLNYAKDQIETALVWAEAAKAAGVSLDEDDKADIDEIIDTLEASAKSSGYNLKTYIKGVYGNAVSEKDIRGCLEILKLAEKYQEQLIDSYSYTEEEWNAHYSENEDDFLKYDYLTYEFEVEEEEEEEETTAAEGTTDAESEAESTEAESTDAETEAEAAVASEEETDAEGTTASDETTAEEEPEEEPIEATYADELAAAADRDAFEAYVRDYLTNVLYKDYTAEELEEDGIDFDSIVADCYVEGEAYDSEAKEGTFAAWVNEEGRKAGDTTVIEDSHGCYVVYMLLGAKEDDLAASEDAKFNYDLFYRETYNLRDFRYIHVAVDSTETDTEAAMTDAYKEAEEIKAEYELNATEENFGTLADKYGEGTYVGGLVENAANDVISDEAAAWIFDEARKAGDVEIIKVEDDGCYIIYYCGEGDIAWQGEVDTALKSAQYKADGAAYAELYDVTFYKKGVNLVKTVG